MFDHTTCDERKLQVVSAIIETCLSEPGGSSKINIVTCSPLNEL